MLCSTVVGWTLAAGVADDSQSLFTKLDRIERGRPGAGARVSLTPGEMQAWAVAEAAARAPESARHARLELGRGQVTASADIDFLKLRQASTGQDAGWLVKNLLTGEHPVRVTASFQSVKGRARVDLDRVEISGVVVEGTTLQFLIENFIRPMFPAATVSEWFELQYGVDHFEVTPTGVSVVIRQ